MSRTRLRLVSCMCLATYLAANTHVNLAPAAFFHGGPSDHFQTTPAATESDEHSFSPCDHCSKRNHSAPVSQLPSSSTSGDSSCPDDPIEPSNSGCPCCPSGPDKDSCPCPGGCALCNVAKVPCLEAPAFFPPVSTCVDDSLLEELFCHVPPFCDGLIRPPRD